MLRHTAASHLLVKHGARVFYAAVAMVQGSPSVGGYATPVWPESGPRNNEGAPITLGTRSILATNGVLHDAILEDLNG